MIPPIHMGFKKHVPLAKETQAFILPGLIMLPSTVPRSILATKGGMEVYIEVIDFAPLHAFIFKTEI